MQTYTLKRASIYSSTTILVRAQCPADAIACAKEYNPKQDWKIVATGETLARTEAC